MPFHNAYSRPTAAQYEAIGRIAANWSIVEFAIESILARLARAPDFPALALTNDLSMDNRLTAMRNLIAAHRYRYACHLIPEELLAKLDSIPSEVSKAKELRNRITHLVWFRRSDTVLFGTKFKGKPPTGKRLEPHQLVKTVDELNEFADELNRLGDSLFDVVAQLPETDETLPGRLP
jgi:hypothetical protein